uniref:UPF0136 membrane protein CG5532 n=1 Tax=Aceria tosichella TaxID=561515 RepID=A0A6G1SHD0_9ACAR
MSEPKVEQSQEQQTAEQSGTPKPQEQQQQQQQQPEKERESVTIDVSQSNQNQQEALSPEAPAKGVKSTFSRCKAGLLRRPIQYDIISIIYTLLILGGGIYAYVNKNSTGSLVGSVVCGILLAFATYFEGCRKNPYPLLVLILILTGFFGHRYFMSMKFIPSGLFALLSVIMLARNCYLIYQKRQETAAASS